MKRRGLILLAAVKEKAESKPKQPTIDLSQMAMPIQLTQEKAGPETPKPSSSDAEQSSDHVTAGDPKNTRSTSSSGCQLTTHSPHGGNALPLFLLVPFSQ